MRWACHSAIVTEPSLSPIASYFFTLSFSHLFNLLDTQISDSVHFPLRLFVLIKGSEEQRSSLTQHVYQQAKALWTRCCSRRGNHRLLATSSRSRGHIQGRTEQETKAWGMDTGTCIGIRQTSEIYGKLISKATFVGILSCHKRWCQSVLYKVFPCCLVMVAWYDHLILVTVSLVGMCCWHGSYIYSINIIT